MAMAAASESEQRIKRTRKALRFACGRGGAPNVPAAEKKRKHTEIFKAMFIDVDTAGRGTLSVTELICLVRKRLKIPARLVPDEHIEECFQMLDDMKSGRVSFEALCAFIFTDDKTVDAQQIANILTQVKRVIRMSMHREHLTLQQLEHRFLSATQEELCEGTLAPEAMRRFFRKTLNVEPHDLPDRNLILAFRAMDVDGSGTLDAQEFVDFIALALREVTTLCPQRPKVPGAERTIPSLLGGMRGVLPSRLPKSRPGTNFSNGVSQLPFCQNGRDLISKNRLTASKTPALMALPSRWSQGLTIAPLGTTAALSRSSSDPCLGLGSGAAAAGAPIASLASSLRKPGSAPHQQFLSTTSANRDPYIAVKGMLEKKDADVLNRIEHRLLDLGVDARGQYYKDR